MAFGEDGKWNFEDSSVEKKITGMMQKDNPFMKAAATQGKQDANRRGLLNTSMGVQAGQMAAIQSALPIASQDAKQTHDANLMSMDLGSKQNIASMNVAAHDREKAMAGTAAAEQAYATMFQNIASNANLPSATRDSYLEHIGAIRDSSLNMVEQMYGIDLDWADTGGPAS